jgi:hypothetical protein
MTGQATHERPTATRTSAKLTSEQFTAGALAAAIEVLPPKAEGKLTINLKVAATGTLFRISPARDPRAPRLWCVAVRQCSSGGILDPTGPAWIDRPGTSWAELADVIETIRADIGLWLGKPVRRDLCRWLLTEPPAATAAVAAGIPGRSTTH